MITGYKLYVSYFDGTFDLMMDGEKWNIESTKKTDENVVHVISILNERRSAGNRLAERFTDQ